MIEPMKKVAVLMSAAHLEQSLELNRSIQPMFPQQNHQDVYNSC